MPGIDSFFHSEFMDGLRNDMLNNTPPQQCGLCVQKDAINAYSVRSLGWDIAKQLDVDWQQGARLRSQDVNFSNLCNIKCRTCSSTLSTKWISDEQRLGMTPRGGGGHHESGWQLDDHTADTISKLEFTGGEPLLHQDQIISALEKVSDKGRLPGLTVDVTTNGMVWPSDRLLDLMARSKRVFFNVSIDAYGGLNDYIRSDSRWGDICATVEHIDGRIGGMPNVWMCVSTVYSLLNANAMIDLWTWLRRWRWQGNNQGIIICYGPEWFDARILPHGFKRLLIERYEDARPMFPERIGMIDAICAHLSQEVENRDMLWKTMLDVSMKLDDLRHIDLRDCNPELAEVIGYDR